MIVCDACRAPAAVVTVVIEWVERDAHKVCARRELCNECRKKLGRMMLALKEIENEQRRDPPSPA
jgi:hypothetical protein